MEKKTIYYIVGGIAVLGIGYYLYNKSKKPAEEKEVTDDNAVKGEDTDETAVKGETKEVSSTTPTATTPTATTPTATTKTPVISGIAKLTAQQLELRLQNKCGKKPKLKKNIRLYNLCRTQNTAKLKNQGLIAFDGSYSFDSVDDFFSGFDSNFDLNL